jgi:hypothetical protein
MSQRTNDQSKADVVLIEKHGRFFFFQPDIGVIASDATVEGAYDKFLGTRRAYLSEVTQAGLTTGGRHGAAAPSRGAPKISAAAAHGGRRIATELAVFVAKLCIVLVVIGGLGAMLGVRAANSIGSALEQVATSRQLSFQDMVRKAADIAKDIQSLTKEEKEVLTRSIGTISHELDPVVDAWRNPPSQ